MYADNAIIIEISNIPKSIIIIYLPQKDYSVVNRGLGGEVQHVTYYIQYVVEKGGTSCK